MTRGHIVSAESHEELKRRLLYIAPEKLHLLQKRRKEGLRWQFVFPGEGMPKDQYEAYLFDFLSIPEARRLFISIRDEDHEFRTVRVGHRLVDGSNIPIVIEVVERFENAKV